MREGGKIPIHESFYPRVEQPGGPDTIVSSRSTSRIASMTDAQAFKSVPSPLNLASFTQKRKEQLVCSGVFSVIFVAAIARYIPQ